MVIRKVFLFCALIFLSHFARAEELSFGQVLDKLDTLSCEQVEYLVEHSKIVSPSANESVDDRYMRHMVETYALLRRCALNTHTREEFYEGQLRGMVEALGDPHSSFMTEREYKDFTEETRGQFFGIGVQLSREPEKGALGVLRVTGAFSGAPAEKAGLRIGDAITKINDRQVSSYKSIAEAVGDMKGARGTSVLLSVTRKEVADPIVLTILRDEIKREFVKTTLLPNKWLLVRLSEFGGASVPAPFLRSICKDIHQMYTSTLAREPKLQGVVLDLRNNPGGFLDGAQCVVNLFAPKSLKGSQLLSVETRDGVYPELVIDPQDILKGKPLVVLVNNRSASASEIVARAVQYYNMGTVVGSTTFGKGSVQITHTFSDRKGAVKYTFAQYLIGPPDNAVAVQGIGVEPNIRMKAKPDPNEEKRNDRYEKGLSGALSTSAVAKPFVVQKTKDTNPGFYGTIVKLISEEPFNMIIDEE